MAKKPIKKKIEKTTEVIQETIDAKYHALINDGNILKIEPDINPNVNTKPGYYWLPVEDVPRPAYDSSIKIAKQTITILEKKVVRDWQIRDKTQIEINDEKMNRVKEVNSIVLDALLSLENRIRELQGENKIKLDEYKNILRDNI